MKKILNLTPTQLAIVSGVLVGISYPPIPGLTAWFGFVPLIHIWLNQSKNDSARLTFLSAIIFNSIAFYWIGLNSGASFVPVFLSLTGAILYLSLLSGRNPRYLIDEQSDDEFIDGRQFK